MTVHGRGQRAHRRTGIRHDDHRYALGQVQPGADAVLLHDDCADAGAHNALEIVVPIRAPAGHGDEGGAGPRAPRIVREVIHVRDIPDYSTLG